MDKIAKNVWFYKLYKIWKIVYALKTRQKPREAPLPL